MRFGWRPILQPGGDVDVLDRQLSRGDVDLDDVAVLQGGQRAPYRRLRRDVTQHQATGGAREPAVGHHRHRFAESFADDRGRDLQHLAHAGPTLRTLVPDDHRVARFYTPRVDRRERVLLAVENAGRAAVRGWRVLRDLGHRAIGRQVALQDDQAAFSPKRAGQRRDDLLAGGLLDRLALLAEGAPGDGQRVAVDVAAIDQTLRQDGDPSGSVQLDRSKTSTGLEVAQQRSTAADAIDI